jgi:hypothetical protein
MNDRVVGKPLMGAKKAHGSSNLDRYRKLAQEQSRAQEEDDE